MLHREHGALRRVASLKLQPWIFSQQMFDACGRAAPALPHALGRTLTSDCPAKRLLSPPSSWVELVSLVEPASTRGVVSGNRPAPQTTYFSFPSTDATTCEPTVAESEPCSCC